MSLPDRMDAEFSDESLDTSSESDQEDDGPQLAREYILHREFRELVRRLGGYRLAWPVEPLNELKAFDDFLAFIDNNFDWPYYDEHYDGARDECIGGLAGTAEERPV